MTGIRNFFGKDDDSDSAFGGMPDGSFGERDARNAAEYHDPAPPEARVARPTDDSFDMGNLDQNATIEEPQGDASIESGGSASGLLTKSTRKVLIRMLAIGGFLAYRYFARS